MDRSLHIPLDLPDVCVLDLLKTEQGAWLIQIESTLEGTTCHKYGRKITKLHYHDEAFGCVTCPSLKFQSMSKFVPSAFAAVTAKSIQPPLKA